MTSRADDYVHGAQTYVFTYTLENVVRLFEDTGADEFYWNVNGTEWRAAVRPGDGTADDAAPTSPER